MRDRKISVPTKLLFGTGQVAESIKSNSLEFFLLFYYVQVLHLDPVLAGVALLLALVMDGITDPIIGAISDRFHSNLGRRHPFMYAAALPAAIAYYCVWNPPSGLEGDVLFPYIVTIAILVRTLVTVYEIPSSSLVAEMSDDYDERTSMLSYR